MDEVDKDQFSPPKIPLEFKGKNEFLYYVGLKDCVKQDVHWRHGFQLIKNLNNKNNTNPRKNKNKTTKKTHFWNKARQCKDDQSGAKVFKTRMQEDA